MNRFRSVGCVIVLALSVCLPGPVVGQDMEKKKALVVNGHSAAGAVLQIDGHSYVDLDALAQVTNASLRIQPDRIILTAPVLNAGPSSSAATALRRFTTPSSAPTASRC